ncbi:MAG TPA: AarF/ABC1/UbiB kinase family protein [Flavobacteriales bacterium]|nr:AarF/ABC1/UbiB kinase family protein [Flavobacteriales bacterium]HIN39035.1 AarF/ABC1/UbiB kinase family protein [Flavobacteriales bacterium]
MIFEKTIQNIKRIRDVIRIMGKYGFEDVVANTSLTKLIPKNKRLSWQRYDRPVLEYSRWERIRMCFEELGATFVKLAQVLSDRPDILPEPLIKEFQKLQSQVKPFEYEKAIEIIESETGRRVEDIFETIDETPIGSASIGQVYKAKLRSGEDVVVKVQRPGVKELVDTDLRILTEVAKRGEAYFEKHGITNILDIVNTFRKTMEKEMDYNHEARSIEQFRIYYKKNKDFYVPKAYKNHTTEKVMVIEYAEGCKITNIKQLKEWKIAPDKLAERGMHIYLSQIFEHGFFHADPHPGNIIIKKSGVICLIDFGMVGKLVKRDKYAIAGIFIGMAQQNAEKMANNLRKLSYKNEITDPRIFENDVNEIIEDFASLDVSEGSMADLIPRLQKLVYDYKMQLPGSIFLILRALAILEGIGKQVSPSMNIYDHLKPYGVSILKEQYSVENITDEIFHRMTQMNSFIRSFPYEVNEILKNVREGKLKIEVEDWETKKLTKKIDLAANRLVLAFLISSLIIGSAIIMMANLDPNDEIPGLSMIGFILAIILSIPLIIAGIKKDKD